MKIALVHCKINYDNMEPFGILLLGTILKNEGHDVLILDIFPGDSSLYLNQLQKFHPEIIGYSIETPAYKRISDINNKIKKLLPNAKRCAGGVHPTAMPEQTLRDLLLDFVLFGEADISFPQVVERIKNGQDYSKLPGLAYLKNNKFIKNSPAPVLNNLDELPILDRSLISYQKFYLSAPGNIRGLFNDRCSEMMTSRGCPFDCTFCGSNVIFGKKIRRRSVNHVIKEINYLQETFDVKTIYFVDDTFTIQPSWVKEFCERLICDKIKLKWCCQSRADTLKPGLLKLMKISGCVQIDVGVESGSPKVLQALRKGETVEMLETAVNNIKRAGLRALCSFVIGAPEETDDDIQKTISFIKRTKPSMSQYFTLSPYPGSPLWDQALSNGWLDNVSFDDSWSLKSSSTSHMQINFTPEELIQKRAEMEKLTAFQDNFYYLIGWFRYPKYLVKLIKAILKFRVPLLNSFHLSFKEKRPQIFVMEMYKSFNKFLLDEALKQSNSEL